MPSKREFFLHQYLRMLAVMSFINTMVEVPSGEKTKEKNADKPATEETPAEYSPTNPSYSPREDAAADASAVPPESDTEGSTSDTETDWDATSEDRREKESKKQKRSSLRRTRDGHTDSDDEYHGTYFRVNVEELSNTIWGINRVNRLTFENRHGMSLFRTKWPSFAGLQAQRGDCVRRSRFNPDTTSKRPRSEKECPYKKEMQRVVFNNFGDFHTTAMEIKPQVKIFLYVDLKEGHCPVPGCSDVDIDDFYHHISFKHNEFLLLSCPNPYCHETFVSLHMQLYHTLMTHKEVLRNFILRSDKKGMVRNCPYGCHESFTDTLHLGDAISEMEHHNRTSHNFYLTQCHCCDRMLDVFKHLFHVWNFIPDLQEIEDTVWRTAREVEGIFKTKGNLCSFDYPPVSGSPLPIIRLGGYKWNCGGLPESLELLVPYFARTTRLN